MWQYVNGNSYALANTTQLIGQHQEFGTIFSNILSENWSQEYFHIRSSPFMPLKRPKFGTWLILCLSKLKSKFEWGFCHRYTKLQTIQMKIWIQTSLNISPLSRVVFFLMEIFIKQCSETTFGDILSGNKIWGHVMGKQPCVMFWRDHGTTCFTQNNKIWLEAEAKWHKKKPFQSTRDSETTCGAEVEWLRKMSFKLL